MCPNESTLVQMGPIGPNRSKLIKISLDIRYKQIGKNWKRKSNLSAGYTSNVPNKEKRQPLLKGSKMIDKRTKVGKSTMAERENVSARELAARAALARFGNAVEASTTTSSKAKRNNNLSDDIKGDDSGDLSDGSSDEEDEEGGINERINKHSTGCGCRSCDWSKLFSLE